MRTNERIVNVWLLSQRFLRRKHPPPLNTVTRSINPTPPFIAACQALPSLTMSPIQFIPMTQTHNIVFVGLLGCDGISFLFQIIRKTVSADGASTILVKNFESTYTESSFSVVPLGSSILCLITVILDQMCLFDCHWNVIDHRWNAK
jgi:hypothetical protein